MDTLKGLEGCSACGYYNKAIRDLEADVIALNYIAKEHKEFVRMPTFKWIVGLLFASIFSVITFQAIILSSVHEVRASQMVIKSRQEDVKKQIEKFEECVDDLWRSRNKERDHRSEGHLEKGGTESLDRGRG